MQSCGVVLSRARKTRLYNTFENTYIFTLNNQKPEQRKFIRPEQDSNPPCIEPESLLFIIYLQALPIQEEYAPPLRLRLFDSRKFGIYVFAGIHITNITHFKFYPITSQERELGLAKGERSSLGIHFKRGV